MPATKNPHLPGALVPADYDYVDGYIRPHTWRDEAGEEHYFEGHNLPDVDAMRKEGSLSPFHRGIGSCDSCGTYHIFGALVWHRPTGTYACFGHVCGANAGLSIDAAKLRELKTRRQTALTRARNAAAWKRFRDDACPELLRALDECTHHIVRDIVGRAKRNGGRVSQKQAELAKKLYRAELRDAQEKAREPSAVPVPIAEKLEVQGRIVSTKVDEYGRYRGLFLVDTPAGRFKLWGTIPSAVTDVIGRQHDRPADGASDEAWESWSARPRLATRGTVVAMTVRNVERSARDESFGFFKRPTRTRILAIGIELD